MNSYFNEDDEKLKWSTESKKTLLSTVVFDVTSHHCKSSENLVGDYIICDTKDWVIVIPEIDDKFLMVKQWRHGEKELSLEFPGGVIDRGEEPEAAALRELKEETGAIPGKLIKLGSMYPNPALFSNDVHIYLAQNLTFTGKQTLDKDEYINYLEMNKKDVINAMGTPACQHGLMGTALMMYMRTFIN